MKPSSIRAVKALRDSAEKGQHADYLTPDESRKLVAACDLILARHGGQVGPGRKARR